MLRCLILICSLCVSLNAVAAEITIDFDDLPPLGFLVIEHPDGSTEITLAGTSLVTIPAGVPLESALPAGVTLQDLFPPVGEVPESAPLPTDYSPYATFSTDSSAGLHYFSGGQHVGSSSPNNITAAVDPDAFPYDENLYVDFTSPVNNLTFTISSDNDFGKIAEVGVYDSDQLIAYLNVEGNADPTDAITIDLTAYANVSRVEVVNVTDTYGLSYDDFHFFTAEVVPEPMTGSLVLVASLLLCPLLKDATGAMAQTDEGIRSTEWEGLLA